MSQSYLSRFPSLFSSPVLMQWQLAGIIFFTICLSCCCFSSCFENNSFGTPSGLFLFHWLPQMELLVFSYEWRTPGMVLPPAPCLCCSTLDLGWCWVDWQLDLGLYIGLTVFTYGLVSRAILVLLRAMPDFQWHPSKRLLRLLFHHFQGFPICLSPGYWVSSGKLKARSKHQKRWLI